MNIEDIERKYKTSHSEFTSEDMSFWTKLIELITNVENNKDKNTITDSLKKINEFLKENEERISKKTVMSWIIDHSTILRETYIMESDPLIDKNTGINYNDEMSADEKINHIAQKMRIILANPNDEEFEYSEDFIKRRDLAGECLVTSEKVVKDCEVKGIEAKGYETKNSLGIVKNGNSNHAFSIVTINGKKYIVDCTYRQFFTLRNNLDDRSKIGLIMMSDEERRKVAEQILRDGWIEATPENLKAYLDGFALSESEKTPSAEEYEMMLDEKSVKYKEKVNTGKKNNPETSETTYIIDSKPNIEQGMNLEEFNIEMSDEEKLMLIVQRERRRLSQLLDKDGMIYDINNDNLRGDCVNSANRICEDCFQKGIKATDLWTKNTLKVSKGLGHHFSLVEIEGKQYIVDCTYRQFFSKTNNEPKDDTSFRDPGMYMVADEKRRKVAEQILKNGWIEATPETLKCYLDGFIMADRKSFDETGISYEEYMEMLQTKVKNITTQDLAKLDKQSVITQSEIKDAKRELDKARGKEKIKQGEEI